MRIRRIALFLVGVITATSAHASTATFSGATNITPGTTSVLYAVSVDTSVLASFDTVSMTIGSLDGLGLSFAYDPAFLAQTTSPTTAPGPIGIYGAVVPGATDVGFNAFRGPGPLWTAPILVGTLTVDTTSLNLGDSASVGIDTAFEVANLGSAVSLVANGPNQDPLSGGVTITVVPEPATLGMLALGGVVAALRRRKA